jgi:uncharacterized membrane protein
MRFFISIQAIAIAIFASALVDAKFVQRQDVSATTSSHPAVTTMPVTSQDGTTIYAEGIGNKDGPHLILAHGYPASAAAFDKLFFDENVNSKVYMVNNFLQIVHGSYRLIVHESGRFVMTLVVTVEPTNRRLQSSIPLIATLKTYKLLSLHSA